MIRLGLRENITAFAPGEAISGAVLWEFPERKELIEVRLVWSTKGKGTEDAATVAVQAMDASKPADTGTFAFTAPDAPHSFDGTLIALVWAVECVVEPGGEFQRIEIVIAPQGREIVLPKIDQPSKNDKFKFR